MKRKMKKNSIFLKKSIFFTSILAILAVFIGIIVNNTKADNTELIKYVQDIIKKEKREIIDEY